MGGREIVLFCFQYIYICIYETPLIRIKFSFTSQLRNLLSEQETIAENNNLLEVRS